MRLDSQRMLLPSKEHVVRDSGQEEDVVQAVDHDRTEKKAHHPSLVLPDSSVQSSIQRSPRSEKNKRYKQMGPAHTEGRTLGRASMDKDGNEGRRYHQTQEQASEESMPARSFPAEEKEPHAEEKCRNNGCYVRLNYQRCAQQWFERYGGTDARVGLKSGGMFRVSVYFADSHQVVGKRRFLPGEANQHAPNRHVAALGPRLSLSHAAGASQPCEFPTRASYSFTSNAVCHGSLSTAPSALSRSHSISAPMIFQLERCPTISLGAS